MYSSDELGGGCGHFYSHTATKHEIGRREINRVFNSHFLCNTQNEIKILFLTFEMQEILTIRHANYKLLLYFITILITMLNKQFL